jgi:hypothetical protein
MSRFHPEYLEDLTGPPPRDHEERLQRARRALLPKRLESAVKQALTHLDPAACLGSWALGLVDSKRLAVECLDEAIAIAQELRDITQKETE